MFECRRRAMLQSFLEAHFVYLCLVHSLSLPFSLTFLNALDSTYVYHMYTLFSHATYLLSHVSDIHMLTDVTTQWRLRSAQPPRCMPKEFSGTRGCSHNLGRTRWGKEDCIRTNYDTICTVCLMYYVRNRSEVSGAEVQRSEGSKRSESRTRRSKVW